MGGLLALLAAGYVVAGFAPGLAVVQVESDEAGGTAVVSFRALSPDSAYFFPDPSKGDWDAYVGSAPPVSWATCYGLTLGWTAVPKIDTPGYVALPLYEGRLGVTFVYGERPTPREWLRWDGTWDFLIRQGGP